MTSVPMTIGGVPHRATLTPDNILIISDTSGFGGPGYHNRAYQFWKNNTDCLQFQIDDSRGWSGMASHVADAIAIARAVFGPDHQSTPPGSEARLRTVAETGIRGTKNKELEDLLPLCKQILEWDEREWEDDGAGFDALRPTLIELRAAYALATRKEQL